MDVGDRWQPPAGAPVIPGLRPQRLLGGGAHGEVWLALDAASGDPVAVKVARSADRQRLAREAALLQRIDHPHVVRLLRTVELDGGGLALVLEYAGGASVAALVAARRRLAPPEVTTVVVPIARAVAALHDRGLVHGDVSGANVLLGDEGRPMLADLGVAAIMGGAAGAERWGTPGWTDPGSSGPPGSGDDVWALGALIRFCLTGDPGGSLDAGSLAPGPADRRAAALLAVADSCEVAADRRPGAIEVSRAVWDACPPAPIRLLDRHARAAPAAAVSAAELTRRIRADAGQGGTAPARIPGIAGRPTTPRARRARRMLPWIGAVVGAGVVAAVGTGMVLARGGADAASASSTSAPSSSAPSASVLSTSAPSTSAPSASSGATAIGDQEFSAIVRALATARATALTHRSAAELAQVNDAGSPAMAADLDVVHRLQATGVRLSGLAFVVEGVHVVSSQAARVTVSATVATSAHRQVDQPVGRAPVVTMVAATAPRSLSLVLVRSPLGWRIQSTR